MTSNPTSRFYLLTTPRTASHLLTRILALDRHENVLPYLPGSDGYFFIQTFALIARLKLFGKRLQDWSDDERSKVLQSYEDDFTKFSGHLKEAQKQGKIVIIKEHITFLIAPLAITEYLYPGAVANASPWEIKLSESHSAESMNSDQPPNITVFADNFLLTWRPIFLIRHPALVFPSMIRIRNDVGDMSPKAGTREGDAQLRFAMNYHWNRTLCDWYVTNHGGSGSQPASESAWPLILDADDVINEPKVLVRLCEMIGLDPKKLLFSWTPDGEPSLVSNHPSVKVGSDSSRMTSTLRASAGPIKDKMAGNIDIDMEAKKWKEEFGENVGQFIEDQVKAAMEDYEYLKAKRLT